MTWRIHLTAQARYDLNLASEPFSPRISVAFEHHVHTLFFLDERATSQARASDLASAPPQKHDPAGATTTMSRKIKSSLILPRSVNHGTALHSPVQSNVRTARYRVAGYAPADGDQREVSRLNRDAHSVAAASCLRVSDPGPARRTSQRIVVVYVRRPLTARLTLVDSRAT